MPLPDPQTAYQNLFEGVRARVFFHKLAQLSGGRYTPTNEKQARDLLDIAGQLQLVEQEAVVKQAEASMDPFAAANMALGDVLARNGFQSVKQAAYDEEMVSIKQAAAAWAQNDDIYNSVLALKANEAEKLAAQLQQG